MGSSLGTCIAAHLQARSLTVRGFARTLGATSSYVSKVIHGTRPVPYDRIADWSAALGLTGNAAAEFKEVALLALAPAEVRELVADLRKKSEKHEGRKKRA